MDPNASLVGVESASPPRRGQRIFARHFLEMVLVMVAGMGILSGVASLAYRAAGSDLSAQPGYLRVALMGLFMTVPMVVWMAARSHAPARTVEMAASMLIPSAVAAVLVEVDAVGVMTGMGIQHAVMVPAMLAVMLWRYGEYAQPHPAHRG
jgi:flagellar biosynthetic protein FliP